MSDLLTAISTMMAEFEAAAEPPVDHGATQGHVETVDLSREEVDALDVEEGLLRDLDRPLGEVRDATRNGEDQSNG